MNPTLGGREWALLVTLSVLWGATFYFVEIALVDLPVFTLVAARVAPAAAVLVAVTYLTGHRLPTSAALWRTFLVMGVLNCLVPFSLIFWGQVRIEGGLAAICNGMTPLFSVILAHYFGRDERLTVPRLAGVGLGLGGVAFLVGPEAADGFGPDGFGPGGIGQLAVLQGLREFREPLGGILHITLLREIGEGFEVNKMDEAVVVESIHWLRERASSVAGRVGSLATG